MDTEICEFENATFFIKDGILTTQAKKGARLTEKDLTRLVNFLVEHERKNISLLVDGADTKSVSFDYLMASKEILYKYINALAYVSDDDHFISSIRNHIEPGHFVSAGQRIRVFSIKDDAVKWLRTQSKADQSAGHSMKYMS